MLESGEILVVETDPQRSAALGLVAQAVGYTPVCVAKTSDVGRTLKSRGFPLALLGLHLAASDQAPPLVTTGESVLLQVREHEPRCVGRRSIFQIIVVSFIDASTSIVNRMHERGADGVIVVRSDDETLALCDMIRDHLAPRPAPGASAGGPATFAPCLSLPPERGAPAPSVPAASDTRFSFVVTGVRVGPRTEIFVNGASRPLPDRMFLVVMILVEGATAGGSPWVATGKLNLGSRDDLPSHIRTQLGGPLPDGSPIIVSDHAGHYRLSEQLDLQIDWRTLLEHSHVAIREMAAKFCAGPNRPPVDLRRAG